MSEKYEEIIRSNLTPLIRENLKTMGFLSDDGVRYFRRMDNFFHYFILSVQNLSKEKHSVRTDGNHLFYTFGEFLIITPNLQIKSSENLQIPVFAHVTNPIAFVTKKHFINASNKIIDALKKIDTDRFSQIKTDFDYVNFHLRGRPSLEKIYHLTSKGMHFEADAWLKLLTHKYRGFRCHESHKDDIALEYYIDDPEKDEIQFFNLTNNERIKFIENLQTENIKRNGLEYLYETT